MLVGCACAEALPLLSQPILCARLVLEFYLYLHRPSFSLSPSPLPLPPLTLKLTNQTIKRKCNSPPPPAVLLSFGIVFFVHSAFAFCIRFSLCWYARLISFSLEEALRADWW